MQACLQAIGFVTAAAIGGGCHAINEIEVCDRRLPEEQVLNVRDEGGQYIEGVHPIAQMPAGGAFVAFVSSASGGREETDTEIRGTLIDAEGQRVPTCGWPEERVYAEPIGPASARVLTSPSFAPPLDDEGEGLLVWRRFDDEDGTSADTYQIECRFLDSEACPFVDMPRFPITELSGAVLSEPVAAPVSRDQGQRFVVVWSWHSGVQSLLRARVVEAIAAAPRFARTSNPRDGSATQGEAVDLFPVGKRFSRSPSPRQNRDSSRWPGPPRR